MIRGVRVSHRPFPNPDLSRPVPQAGRSCGRSSQRGPAASSIRSGRLSNRTLRGCYWQLLTIFWRAALVLERRGGFLGRYTQYDYRTVTGKIPCDTAEPPPGEITVFEVPSSATIHWMLSHRLLIRGLGTKSAKLMDDAGFVPDQCQNAKYRGPIDYLILVGEAVERCRRGPSRRGFSRWPSHSAAPFASARTTAIFGIRSFGMPCRSSRYSGLL